MTWYNNSWNYRKAITVSNSGSTLTDYQILVTVDTASLISSTKMRSDCGDIRFTDTDGSTLLYYWIESGINTTSTKIWIKIPSVVNGSNTIYLYYNNPSEISTSSGTDVFDFFDDFLVSGVDSSKWSITPYPSIIGDGTATFHDPGSNQYLLSNAIFNQSLYKIQVRFLLTPQSGYYESRLFMGFSSSTYPSGGVGLPMVYHADNYGNSINTISPYYNSNTVSFAFTDNYYYVATVSMSADYKHTIKIGNTTATSTTALTSAYNKIFVGGSYINGKVDYILCRKNVSPEPTACIGGETTLVSGNEVSTTSWLTGWNKRKSITINGSTTGAQTDYQMKLIVHKETGTDTSTNIYLGTGTNIKDNFSDLRFTNQDGSTLLNYWIESISSTPFVATVWIKIPLIPASPCTSTIYVYYSKTDATAVSNGTNTFIYFDDFEGSGLLSWTNNAGTWTTSGGYRKHLSGTGYFQSSYISIPLTEYIVTAKIYFNSVPSGIQGLAVSKNAGTGNFWRGGDIGYGTADFVGIFSDDETHWGGLSTGTNFKQTNTWYRIQVARVGSTVKEGAYYANVSNDSFQTEYAAGLSNTIAGLHSNANIETWFDDFRVRKYASPEPTFGAIGSEELSTGSLDMSSTPSGAIGASVYIDGNVTPSGVTPLIVTGFSPGTHTYRLTKTGYTEIPATNFNIIAGQTTTISQAMLTVTNITATLMTITPNETPCRHNICTVTVDVTWTNNGGTTGSFVPNITIDTVPVSPDPYPSEELAPSANVKKTFIISNLAVGTHNICPYPN